MGKRVSLAELAHGVATRATIPVSFAEEFVGAFFSVIEENLILDKLVKVKGLGTFKLVDVEARESVHVGTGERILLSGHTKVSFTPDPVIRDAINRPFADFETVILSDETPTALMEAVDDETVETAVVQPIQEETPVISAVEDQMEHQQADEQQPEVVVEEPVTDEEILPDPVAEESSQQVASLADVPQEAPKVDEAGQEDAVTQAPVDDEPAQEEPVAAEPSIEETVQEEATMENVPVEDNQSEPEPEEVAPAAQPLMQDEDEYDDNDMDYIDSESNSDMRRNIILSILSALLCMFIGYAICYYFRPFELPTFTPEPQLEDAQQAEVVDDKDGTAPVKPSKDAASTTAKEETKEAPAAVSAAADYPQVEGGEYAIVGVLANDTMKVGKMLTKMAIQYYGNKDLYVYICAMNHIDNPDVVPLNKPLLIPKLEKK